MLASVQCIHATSQQQGRVGHAPFQRKNFHNQLTIVLCRIGSDTVHESDYITTFSYCLADISSENTPGKAGSRRPAREEPLGIASARF